MDDVPFTVHHIPTDAVDKTIKGMTLPGPHPTSVPESWIEFKQKIFVIYYTPGVVENSNLFAFDLVGRFLWRALGTLTNEAADHYCAFTWSPEDGRFGSALWGGGGVLLDEETGAILERWDGK